MGRPQRRLDRYQLVRLLGRGGQGEVWEALQEGVDGVTRPVALKLLDRDHASLRREARLTSLLRHPHLVDVLELGETDGVAWCAMERCDRSLADAPVLSPRALVEVGLQICEALGYAHDALELVHLDLKPGNLLVRDGRVKVADLGIARARGFEGDGTVRGTPRYMAPEQRVQGPVDARTDVFALGRVLEVLAQGPRSDDTEATVPAGSVGVPTDPCPPWLQEVVRRCTEPDPRDRYPSMAAVAADLRRLAVDGPDLAGCLGLTPTEPPAPDAPIGREYLVRAALHALDDGPVILVGPPGIGKSRVASAVREGFEGPAWIVDVAEIARPGGLIRAVARALDVPLRTTAGASRQVGQALRSRGLALLVLDSVERTPDLASVLGTWTADAPELRVLLTSRVAGPLPGAHAIDVPPLDPPDARALLALRARERGVDPTADPGFGPLADRLDGVPLALELAAGRLGVLTASEVLERLDAAMLRSGQASVSRRHATLQDALEWSRELLSPGDRTLLAELAVFRGSFTPEDAGAVASDRPGVPAGLERLAAHNLVRTAGTRRSLLGPVRDASIEHLERLDAQGVRDRHARWFARHGAPDRLRLLDGARHDEAFEHMATDRAELEAAVEHAVRRGMPLVAAGAALAAARVLAVRGPLEDGLAVLDRALTVPSGREGELHVARAGLLAGCGRTDEAVEALAREQAHGGLTALSFRTRGDVAMARGAFGDAERWFALERDAAAARGLPDGRAWLGIGAARLQDGRPEAAAEALDRARDALIRAGDLRGLAAATTNLGVAARRLGRPDEALAFHQRALGMDRAAGAPASVASSLANLAILEVHAGRPDRGLTLLTEALGLAESVGFRKDAALHRSNLAELALHLGDLDTARQHALGARAVYLEAGNAHLAGAVELVLGRVAAEQGDLVAARAHMEAARPAGPHVELVLGRLALQAGDVPEALALVERCIAGGPGTAPDALARIVRAECLVALGHDPPRQDVLDALSTLRAVSPTVAVEGLCAASRALGDRALWEEARALADTCDIRPGSPIGRELARGQGTQEKV